MRTIDHYDTLRRGREELLCQAEYERMVRAANLRKWTNWLYHRTFANRLGTYLVKCGQRLKQFGAHKRLQSSSPASPHH